VKLTGMLMLLCCIYPNFTNF